MDEFDQQLLGIAAPSAPDIDEDEFDKQLRGPEHIVDTPLGNQLIEHVITGATHNMPPKLDATQELAKGLSVWDDWRGHVEKNNPGRKWGEVVANTTKDDMVDRLSTFFSQQGKVMDPSVFKGERRQEFLDTVNERTASWLAETGYKNVATPKQISEIHGAHMFVEALRRSSVTTDVWDKAAVVSFDTTVNDQRLLMEGEIGTPISPGGIVMRRGPEATAIVGDAQKRLAAADRLSALPEPEKQDFVRHSYWATNTPAWNDEEERARVAFGGAYGHKPLLHAPGVQYNKNELIAQDLATLQGTTEPYKIMTNMHDKVLGGIKFKDSGFINGDITKEGIYILDKTQPGGLSVLNFLPNDTRADLERKATQKDKVVAKDGTISYVYRHASPFNVEATAGTLTAYQKEFGIDIGQARFDKKMSDERVARIAAASGLRSRHPDPRSETPTYRAHLTPVTRGLLALQETLDTVTESGKKVVDEIDKGTEDRLLGNLGKLWVLAKTRNPRLSKDTKGFLDAASRVLDVGTQVGKIWGTLVNDPLFIFKMAFATDPEHAEALITEMKTSNQGIPDSAENKGTESGLLAAQFSEENNAGKLMAVGTEDADREQESRNSRMMAHAAGKTEDHWQQTKDVSATVLYQLGSAVRHLTADIIDRPGDLALVWGGNKIGDIMMSGVAASRAGLFRTQMSLSAKKVAGEYIAIHDPKLRASIDDAGAARIAAAGTSDEAARVIRMLSAESRAVADEIAAATSSGVGRASNGSINRYGHAFAAAHSFLGDLLPNSATKLVEALEPKVKAFDFIWKPIRDKVRDQLQIVPKELPQRLRSALSEGAFKHQIDLVHKLLNRNPVDEDIMQAHGDLAGAELKGDAAGIQAAKDKISRLATVHQNHSPLDIFKKLDSLQHHTTEMAKKANTIKDLQARVASGDVHSARIEEDIAGLLDKMDVQVKTAAQLKNELLTSPLLEGIDLTQLLIAQDTGKMGYGPWMSFLDNARTSIKTVFGIKDVAGLKQATTAADRLMGFYETHAMDWYLTKTKQAAGKMRNDMLYRRAIKVAEESADAEEVMLTWTEDTLAKGGFPLDSPEEIRNGLPAQRAEVLRRKREIISLKGEQRAMLKLPAGERWSLDKNKEIWRHLLEEDIAGIVQDNPEFFDRFDITGMLRSASPEVIAVNRVYKGKLDKEVKRIQQEIKELKDNPPPGPERDAEFPPFEPSRQIAGGPDWDHLHKNVETPEGLEEAKRVIEAYNRANIQVDAGLVNKGMRKPLPKKPIEIKGGTPEERHRALRKAREEMEGSTGTQEGPGPGDINTVDGGGAKSGQRQREWHATRLEVKSQEMRNLRKQSRRLKADLLRWEGKPERVAKMLKLFSVDSMDDVLKESVDQLKQLGQSAWAQLSLHYGGDAWTSALLPSHLKGRGTSDMMQTTKFNTQVSGTMGEVFSDSLLHMSKAEQHQLMDLMKNAGSRERFMKKNPGTVWAAEQMVPTGDATVLSNVDNYIKHEAAWQASLIERGKASGFIDEATAEHMSRLGYDPGMYGQIERPKLIDTPAMKKVKQTYKDDVKGEKPPLDASELRFKRHLTQYRVYAKEADGFIHDELFDTELGAAEFIEQTFGAGARESLGTKVGHERISKTTAGAEIKIADPIGPEAARALGFLKESLPERRLARFVKFERDLAMHDFLTGVKGVGGMVLTPAEFHSMLHRQGKARTAFEGQYLALPNNPQQYGNLSGNFVHRSVVSELNTAAHSFEQLKAVMDELTDQYDVVPKLLTSKFYSKALANVNSLVKTSQILLSWKTWVGNVTFNIVANEFTGGRVLDGANRANFVRAIKEVTEAGFTPRMMLGGAGEYIEAIRGGVLSGSIFDRNTGIQFRKMMLHATGLDDAAKINRRKAAVLEQRNAIYMNGRKLTEPEVKKLGQMELEIASLEEALKEQSKDALTRLIRGSKGFFMPGKTATGLPDSSWGNSVRLSYGMIDDIWRYATYLNLKAEGKTAAQAAWTVKKFMQDYGNLPAAVSKLSRHPLGSLVPAFPFELLRLTNNYLKYKPLRLMALTSIMPALNMVGATTAGVPLERVTAGMRAQGQSDLGGMVAFLASNLMIWNSRTHNLESTIGLANTFIPFAQAVNGFGPLSAIADKYFPAEENTLLTNVARAVLNAGATFIGNNPTLNTGTSVLTGNDPMTGKPLFNPDSASWGDRGRGVMRAIGRSLTPPWAPFVGSVDLDTADALDAPLHPETGRPYGAEQIGTIRTRALLNIPVKGKLVGGGDVVNDALIMSSLMFQSQKNRNGSEYGKSLPLYGPDATMRRYWAQQKSDASTPEEKAAAEEGLKKLAATEKRYIVSGEEYKRLPTEREQSRFMRAVERRGALAHFTELDLIEQALTLTHANAAGVSGKTLTDYVQAASLTERWQPKLINDPGQVVEARRIVERWLKDPRARPELLPFHQWLVDIQDRAINYAPAEEERLQRKDELRREGRIR